MKNLQTFTTVEWGRVPWEEKWGVWGEGRFSHKHLVKTKKKTLCGLTIPKHQKHRNTIGKQFTQVYFQNVLFVTCKSCLKRIEIKR